MATLRSPSATKANTTATVTICTMTDRASLLRQRRAIELRFWMVAAAIANYPVEGTLARECAPALASGSGWVRTQRNGGEYWSPPSVHSALSPRARPIGVFTPMLRSKISP